MTKFLHNNGFQINNVKTTYFKITGGSLDLNGGGKFQETAETWKTVDSYLTASTTGSSTVTMDRVYAKDGNLGKYTPKYIFDMTQAGYKSQLSIGNKWTTTGTADGDRVTVVLGGNKQSLNVSGKLNGDGKNIGLDVAVGGYNSTIYMSGANITQYTNIAVDTKKHNIGTLTIKGYDIAYSNLWLAADKITVSKHFNSSKAQDGYRLIIDNKGGAAIDGRIDLIGCKNYGLNNNNPLITDYSNTNYTGKGTPANPGDRFILGAMRGGGAFTTCQNDSAWRFGKGVYSGPGVTYKTDRSGNFA
jgi:hypothetical protein